MNLFDEIKSYVGFTEADAQRLQQLRPVVEPYFESVVEGFYDRLMANPRARGVFVGPEQIARLRQTLLQWLREVFSGPYDQAYFKRRDRIGRVHVEVGLLPQFMFGAMNLIRNQIVEILLGDERHRLQEVFDGQDGTPERLATASVDRILDIELTLMVQSYWDEMMKQKLEIPAALATGLAHEVRNPLNSIGLQMTLLERKLRGAQVDSDVYEPVLEAVQTELRRIKEMNTEILDFAKPVAVERTPVDLLDFFEELRRSHKLTLDAGGVEMEIETNGDVVFDCDRNRMTQVFVNLLTNAVEALENGGTIRVVVEQKEGGVVVEFSDDGEGMPPTMKYQIFDLFHTTKAAGTGIGLAIARKIVEAHDGSIDVLSRPGEGATFTVYLPDPIE